jgi:zinc transport system substrate-binding protein
LRRERYKEEVRRPLLPFLLCLIPLLFLAIVSCQRNSDSSGSGTGLKVVTTLFPLYDFSRNIGGEKAHVALLLPPGIEPHSFDPKPRDILAINEADLFVFTGSFMEPWANSLIKGIQGKRLVVVDSSKDATLLPEIPGGEDEREDHHNAPNHGEPIDPHIWLDLSNAQKMIDNILAGFVERDPQNRRFYEKNAADYKARLQGLDEQFRKGLNACETRLFVHGGHYAFNYLARRYNLTYVSVYGFSPNAEPSPRHIADIIRTMRQHKTTHVFYEELIQPRVAETIAKETGAELLPLNGGHNVTKEELTKGVTFISLLEQDLRSLKAGLQCR